MMQTLLLVLLALMLTIALYSKMQKVLVRVGLCRFYKVNTAIALSNNDVMHNGMEARNEYARFNQALSDDALSTFDNEIKFQLLTTTIHHSVDNEIQP
ncbi:uncharacterized protein ATC70_005773 [Mucor velutinosus]|uniref:Uncharacterized protein n=1 Tax=Mucor velutinosus TaxID=708070 RepID=A0AAN7DAA6_9FUNG|nr:hypothetical protein ATC70_005773 [Mucor velutinosus]